MNATSSASDSTSTETTAQAPALEDDLDLNEPLGERQGAACSMEEGCESCQ